MSAKQIVEDAIAGNKIVIFSKSFCPYCKRAKGLLTLDFAHMKDQIYIKECVLFHWKHVPGLTTALRLDEAPNGNEIQDYLREKSGQSTVPNIYINQKHIGGKSQSPVDLHPITPANGVPQVATLLCLSRTRTSSSPSSMHEAEVGVVLRYMIHNPSIQTIVYMLYTMHE